MEPCNRHELLVSRGLMHGQKFVNINGFNPDVDTTEEQDIWAPGGTRVFPTDATQVSLVSESIEDDGVGLLTGAYTVWLQGLDTDFYEQEEIVVLNGLTPSLSIGTYSRVLRITCLTAGSTAANQGSINASIDGELQCSIISGANLSTNSHFTIPEGYTGHLNLMEFYTNRSQPVNVKLLTRLDTYLWLEQLRVASAGIDVLPFQYGTPLFPPRTEVKMVAIADQVANHQVGGAYTLLLVPTTDDRSFGIDNRTLPIGMPPTWNTTTTTTTAEP